MNIGYAAFFACKSLTSVTIPNSVASIGYQAFDACNRLTSITVNENNANYKSIDGNLYSKDETVLIQYAIGKSDTSFAIPTSVKIIDKTAFRYCRNLTSISIPPSVTSIEEEAFFASSSLTSITIPSSITSIGYGVFENCVSLTNIIIPDSVTNIGNFAFSNCKSLTSITVSENNANYKSIDGNLYSKDGTVLIQYAIGKSDTSFVIPNSVTIIESGAFDDCISLASVTIPNSVTSIGNFAFCCTSLVSIDIPSSVTNIGGQTFEKCSNLTSVTIPLSVTRIGDRAFYDCTSLKTIKFSGTESEWNSITKGLDWDANTGDYTVVFEKEEPDDDVTGSKGLAYTLSSDGTYYSVSGIGTCTDKDVIIPAIYDGLPVKEVAARAFRLNKDITSVTIPDSVTSIGELAFQYCECLTSVTIPYSVTSIGNNVFAACVNLASVIIPNSVTSINSNAFYNCISLTSVNIPDSVVSIGDFAFGNCSSLTTIEIPNSVKSIGNMVLYNCTSLSTINFLGTENEWNAITKGSRWDANTGDYTVTFADNIDTGDGKIPVTSITLSETQVVMPVGSRQWIEVSVYPENATDQMITWTTGSLSVADIAWSGDNNSRGLIVAKSEGTTIITASTADGKVLAQCTVIVYVA